MQLYSDRMLRGDIQIVDENSALSAIINCCGSPWLYLLTLQSRRRQTQANRHHRHSPARCYKSILENAKLKRIRNRGNRGSSERAGIVPGSLKQTWDRFRAKRQVYPIVGAFRLKRPSPACTRRFSEGSVKARGRLRQQCRGPGAGIRPVR